MTIFCWNGSIGSEERQLYPLLLGDFWEIAKQICHRLSHVDMAKIVCNDTNKGFVY